MPKVKTNPYELGVQHAKERQGGGFESRNPYKEFSEQWALYNRGYNVTAFPEYFRKERTPT